MTASPFRLLIVCPAPLAVRYLSSCGLSFLPMQVCRGRALQLIRDLPVEFHCDKGSYSCRRDGEKAALAASIALLRGISKMKRLDFEACLLPNQPLKSMQCCSAFSAPRLPLRLLASVLPSIMFCCCAV